MNPVRTWPALKSMEPIVHVASGEHLEDGGADGRCPRVAGFELVHAAGELAGEARLVDLEVLDDGREIA